MANKNNITYRRPPLINTSLKEDPKVSRKPVSPSSASSDTDSSEETSHHNFDGSSKPADSLLLDENTEYPALPQQEDPDHPFWKQRSQTKGLKLEDIEFTEDDVVLENNEVDNLQQVWGHCLIGYFPTRFPGKQALSEFCNSWHVKVKFYVHPSRWIIFKFENEADSELVLQRGHYFVLRKPLLMKPMPACFEFDDKTFNLMPVWIQLPSLPLECWNARALSKIASRVGTPFCMDTRTHNRERVSFARVLVEVDASEELVRSVRIKLPVGKIRVQPVIFEYEPRIPFLQ